MAERRYERLVELVESRAGDYFRTGVRYTDDDWEPLYQREDLPVERLRERTRDIVERAREHDPMRDTENPFGGIRATIELYENGVVMHLRESPTTGVILTFEQGAARSLAGFVVECERVLS